MSIFSFLWVHRISELLDGPVIVVYCSEKSIRPMTQGRRNYLFSNTVSGAEATIIASTLIETAKANGAEPFYYLKYILEQMPKHLYDKGQKHLPETICCCACGNQFSLYADFNF